MTSQTAQRPGPVLEIEDLVVTFGSGARSATALNRVSTRVERGQTLGIVGESGSGKSTLAKAIVGVNRPASGRILFNGSDIASMRSHHRRNMRRAVQMIPQDPYSSLDPRRTIGETMAEAIDPRRADFRRNRERISYWLSRARLDPGIATRYPHQFSGGQRQRVAIARALAVEPELIIADEITSALDLSVQAEILDLIDELRAELDLTMLFISHNLEVVRRVCDTILVLYHGDVVEAGDISAVYDNPQAQYTRELLASVPGAPGFDIG